VCLIAPIAATTGQTRRWLTAGIVATVVVLQPARAAEAWHRWRAPQYGVLVQGVRAIVADGRPVREIEATFAVPAGMDVYFLHALLHGRLDPSGPVAQIDGTGSVGYR
jgi:hypothetical protein